LGRREMDVKRARSPHGEDDKKRAGWRGSSVRPELVLVAFLLTLPLLVFVFGGRWGSSSSSPSGNKPVDRRHVDGSATPQSKPTFSALALFQLVNCPPGKSRPVVGDTILVFRAPILACMRIVGL
jgi:hypothetical protein